jgi:signal transduction histidine kinase
MVPRNDMLETRQASTKSPSRANAIRVLVVDDEDAGRLAIAGVLRSEGFFIHLASDGASALRQVCESRPDVVIADLSMPVMGGIELCERLQELDPDLPVILVTAFGDMESVVLGMRAGAHDYLTKPLQMETVLASVLEVVERRAEKVSRRSSRPPVAAAKASRVPITDAIPSSAVVPAKDSLDRVVVRRKQLARVANELRTINERLVISSIREQEHAEREAQQRAQLDALLGNLSEGVVIADAHGQIRMINQAASHMLGLEGQPPQTVDELAALEARATGGVLPPIGERPLARALRGEEFAECELHRARPGGDERRLVASGTNVKDERGNVELAILVLRDVTELRRLERQREEFTALISHDLRNPLNSIQLLAATIRSRAARNAPVEQAAELAQRIEQNVVRMASMVDEILEAAQLETQSVELSREVCDLRKLVDEVVFRLDDVRAHRVVVEGEDAPYSALADQPRLERAITNLVTNALKYSPGDANVRVLLTRRGSDIVINVVDRGIGIAREDLARLFERYYRAPSGKRIGGIGLGLYITRLLAEAHGGRIEVESAPGQGSSFKLVLPAHFPDGAPPPEPSQAEEAPTLDQRHPGYI